MRTYLVIYRYTRQKAHYISPSAHTNDQSSNLVTHAAEVTFAACHPAFRFVLSHKENFRQSPVYLLGAAFSRVSRSPLRWPDGTLMAIIDYIYISHREVSGYLLFNLRKSNVTGRKREASTRDWQRDALPSSYHEGMRAADYELWIFQHFVPLNRCRLQDCVRNIMLMNS